MNKASWLLAVAFLVTVGCASVERPAAPAMTQAAQAAFTPDRALTALREGNARFADGRMAVRDLRSQVKATGAGQ